MFDDDENIADTRKTGLKKVSSKKSIFDGQAKKPTQRDLEENVKNIQNRDDSFKSRTSALAVQLKKILDDKTLAKNKTIFVIEKEREVLSSIIQLAAEVNNDEYEAEGMGSLSWIAQLFKITLSQRDRMNNMEYSILQLQESLKNLQVDKSVKSG